MRGLMMLLSSVPMPSDHSSEEERNARLEGAPPRGSKTEKAKLAVAWEEALL